ncbi:hypothetical protein [Paracoccus contaminans]|uniref:Uncharacterized protein n=1 Tax=Paracoccus contaminans TaxID=1945662 RepID=A0A1W6CXP5_9RHOB|nr:hypothetical protein [Paracoccus contaminans]ARJ69615.1 hypothetical protein B0A89_08245 [Paracoccus contaminans]
MAMITRLALVCLVLATSLALGRARGHLPDAAAATVLCSGGAVILGGSADPGGKAAQLCPDMALAFLAGLDHPPPSAPALLGRFERLSADLRVTPGARRITAAQARGPPPRARSRSRRSYPHA